MNVPNLVIIVIFGLTLISQYIVLAMGKFGLSQDQMWGNTPQLFRDVSLLTIVLAFIAGLYLSYYLSLQEGPFRGTVRQIFQIIGLMLLVVVSNLWIPMMVIGSAIGSLLVLSLVALGSILILVTLLYSDDFECICIDGPGNVAAIVAGSILVFQTLVMDAIVWNVYSLA